MSREDQLTRQLTCRKPRAPTHRRAGSAVDVTATGFPVTSTISASLCVCAWFVINLLLPLENEALPSCLPASSRTCQVSLFLLHAITAKGWHSQKAHACSGSLHHWTSLCTVMYCPDTHSVFAAPPGAKASDVQFGRHVVPCHSPSTSARSAQSRRSNVTDSTRGQPGLYSQVEAVHEPHQHFRSLAREVLRAQVGRVCFGRDLLHRQLVVTDRLLEPQVLDLDVLRFARPCSA